MGTHFQRSKNSVLRATQSTVLHTKIQPGFQCLVFWHLPIVCTLCLFISLIRYWQEELRTLILNLIWESESLSFPAAACPWVTATIIWWFIFTYSAWKLHCICILYIVFLPDTEDKNSNQHRTSARAYSWPHPHYLQPFLMFHWLFSKTRGLSCEIPEKLVLSSSAKNTHFM